MKASARQGHGVGGRIMGGEGPSGWASPFASPPDSRRHENPPAIPTRPRRAIALLAVVALAASWWAAAMPGAAAPELQRVPVEDWSTQSAGSSGIPEGWKPYATPGGRPRYDFSVVRDGNQAGLLLRSHDDHSTIVKQIDVDLRATPILEWSWKVTRLPDGADIRSRATSDLTGHLLVVWPRVPAMLRSRLIGYVWDAATPPWTMERSRKTGLVVFFSVRTGAADIGRWVAERRDVRADYRAAFEEEPESPRAVAISIDTNDTHSTAEAVIGPIAFTASPAARSTR